MFRIISRLSQKPYIIIPLNHVPSHIASLYTIFLVEYRFYVLLYFIILVVRSRVPHTQSMLTTSPSSQLRKPGSCMPPPTVSSAVTLLFKVCAGKAVSCPMAMLVIVDWNGAVTGIVGIVPAMAIVGSWGTDDRRVSGFETRLGRRWSSYA